MLVPEADRALAVSVGVEPSGVPRRVLHLGGGPATFVELLDEQLLLREQRAVPRLRPPDGWLIEIDGASRAAERANDALLTTSDGVVATAGTAPLASPGAVPAVWHNAVYRGHGVDTALAPGPLWDRIHGIVPADAALTRRLDLNAGVLEITIDDAAPRTTTTRFASLDHPGTLALRTTIEPDVDDPPLVAPSRTHASQGERDGVAWMVTGNNGDGVTAAARDHRGERGSDRLACYVPGRAVDEAMDALAAAERLGFDALLSEHRASWAARWRSANVTIAGDPDLDLAVRFSLFHLLQCAPTSGEAAVGARGLTGPAYHGHVFWDADVFVLPTLAATLPAAARAMLEYRVRRLSAAMVAARAEGRRGARFPWESAAAGDDVTPRAGRTRAGEIVPILTGPAEVHIVADVALAAASYIDWTGDEEFARGAGRRLFAETARYWVSRVRFDDDGRAHIDGVIGPDEYHELVDDNAFTNVMARWNLRRAAAAVGDAVASDETARWLHAADALDDGFDPATGRYEQFRGFFDLDDLVIADVAPRRPVTADLLLGRERVMRSQVIKQADVLMLHHLVADSTAPGSLRANLDYYEPRCAHGSSLSPGVHASLLARAGRFDAAVDWLRVAARVDLDDITGTTSGGVHLATMGSVWQALTFGFAGLRPDGEALAIDAARPVAWPSYEVRVTYRGTPVRVRVGDTVVVEADGPLQVSTGDSVVDCSDALVDLGPTVRREEE
jgi:trehalose/maltose hydrolase-like predicted phosphorylase